MRVLAILAIGALSACTPNAPDEVVVYEVPPAGYAAPPTSGTVSSAGGAYAGSYGHAPGPAILTTDPVPPITSVGGPAAGSAAGVTAVAGGQTVSQIEDDRLNLAEFSLEQQRIDAAAAERDLEAARQQLLIIQPGSVPGATEGPNIALYAQQTTNAVGDRIYPRSRGMRIASSCGRYSGNGDAAQRAFLAAGGPQSDSLNLDPDGDGFACHWDPAPYRALH